MIDDLVMVSEMVDVRNGVPDHHEKGIHPVPQGATHLGFDGKDVSVASRDDNRGTHVGSVMRYARRKGVRRHPDSAKHIVRDEDTVPHRRKT